MIGRALGAAVAACIVATGAVASAAPSASMVAAANAEGAVVWYTTTEKALTEPLIARFNAHYPHIAVQTLIVGQTALAPRVTTEQLGGKFVVDLVANDDLSVMGLVNGGALQPYRIAEADKYTKGTIDPGGLWTTLYENSTVIAWNTERLKADHLAPPASLADLAKPEWHGHLAVDGADLPWYLGTLAGRPDAADLIAKIAAQHPLITNGHTFTLSQLETGEFDATPTAYAYLVEKERLAGRPVDFVRPKPAIIVLTTIGLVKNAPHPNAARLFLDWLFSHEGQLVFTRVGGRTSARTDMPVNARVFDPKQPYVIERAPEHAAYAAAESQFKTLFGIGY